MGFRATNVVTQIARAVGKGGALLARHFAQLSEASYRVAAHEQKLYRVFKGGLQRQQFFSRMHRRLEAARLATKLIISRHRQSQRNCLAGGPEPSLASGLTPAPFLIGKNRRGNWVVQDASGLRGGLFVDRTQALKFAMSENGIRPRAVIMVPDGLELDMNAKPRTGERSVGNFGLPALPRFAGRARRKVA